MCSGPTYQKLKQSGKLHGTSLKPKRSRSSSRSRSRSTVTKPRKISTEKFLKKLLAQSPQPHLRRILRSQISKSKEGRGIRTRGWRGSSPRSGSERHYLSTKCGKKCFLGPNESFPICSKCRGGKCDCRIDCRGVIAASVRAHQYKHKGLYGKIKKLSKKCKV